MYISRLSHTTIHPFQTTPQNLKIKPVRERAKQLVELLGDNERIREEREKARRLRDKFVGIGVHGGVRGIGGALEGYEGGGGGGRDGGGSRYGAFVGL